MTVRGGSFVLTLCRLVDGFENCDRIYSVYLQSIPIMPTVAKYIINMNIPDQTVSWPRCPQHEPSLQSTSRLITLALVIYFIQKKCAKL